MEAATVEKEGQTPQTADQKNTMKAVVCPRYGSPDVLELRIVDKPAVPDDQVLVRVKAVSVNPADWHLMRGEPYILRMMAGFRKPKRKIMGSDFAGRVEAVGKNVTEFQPGDEVFGMRGGSFADYVSVPQDGLVRKPANITFEQAAAIPIAALTALQGLRDKGKIHAGQKVLIIGASGGVGTFAVQIAKSFGAEVTGVCSTGKVDLVRSIGADYVIDYTREDFAKSGKRYDMVVYIAGTRSFSDCKKVLAPKGTLVLVGSSKMGKWMIGALGSMLKETLLSRFRSQKTVFFISKQVKADMVFLKDLIEAGRVTPMIDRRYQFSEAADAVRYLEEGHARAKVVITV